MYRLIGQTYHTVKIDQRIESLQFKHHDFFYNVVKWLPVYALIVLERAVKEIFFKYIVQLTSQLKASYLIIFLVRSVINPDKEDNETIVLSNPVQNKKTTV